MSSSEVIGRTTVISKMGGSEHSAAGVIAQENDYMLVELKCNRLKQSFPNYPEDHPSHINVWWLTNYNTPAKTSAIKTHL